MAEIWGAAIIAGGAIIGAEVSSSGAKSAANAQAQAAGNASQVQWNMYDQTRTDQAPWRSAGSSAIGALANYYGLPSSGDAGSVGPAGSVSSVADRNKMIQGLPGYQFNMDQGNQAVQRDLAAKGLLGSGAAGKALTQYGQGYATQATGQYLNGLQSLAGIGQTSVQATGAAGMNAANQVGSNDIYAGNAQASGYASQSNAINSGLSGLVGAVNYSQRPGYQPQYNNYNAPSYVGGAAPNYDPSTVNYSNNLSDYGG